MSSTHAASPAGACSAGRKAIRAGIGVGVLLAVLAGLIGFMVERSAHQQREIQVRQLVTAVAHDLGGRLDRSLSAVIALSAVLRQGNGKVDNFPLLARELINQFGGITALQLAPGGTISQVEPLPGHERVIGFSPLNDPIQGPEARRSVELRTLVLTGPFDLRQGGVGVVGRNPVFIRTPDGKEHFWGLVQVLIRVPDLLVMTRLDALEQAGLRYELWRMRPDGGGRHVFASSSGRQLENPVDIVIKVPNGEWVLSAAPENGWHSRLARYGMPLVVLVVALLGGAASFLLLYRGRLNAD